MMILPLWGLLLIVTVTMQKDFGIPATRDNQKAQRVSDSSLKGDMIQFTEFSGVFTSPDYPVTPPYFTRRWSITVKEDCRILLHFLDFGLRKSNLCIPEYVELYDGAFKTELEVAKLCYSDYSEMNPSTYISSGHIFLIKLKTGCCYDRKGFKANYSSIPKESKTTAVPNVTTTKQTTKPTPKRTSTTRNVSDEPTLTTSADILSSTKSPISLPSMPSVTVASKNPATIPDVLSSTTSTISLPSMPSVTVASKNPATIPGIIAAIVVALISVILCLATAMWKSKRCKHKNGEVSDRSQLCPPTQTSSITAYEDVQRVNGSRNPTHHENQGEEQTNETLQQSSSTHQGTSPRSENKDMSNHIYETIDGEAYGSADPDELRLYI